MYIRENKCEYFLCCLNDSIEFNPNQVVCRVSSLVRLFLTVSSAKPEAINKMSVEVVKTVPCDARNTLCRHRDAFKEHHGVSVFFPRNRVRGANQEMVLKGGPRGIANVEREIEKVLGDWRVEFEDFLNRRRLRRDDSHGRPRDFPGLSKLSKVSKVSKVSNVSNVSNMFALLDPDEEMSCPEVSTEVEVPVVKPRRGHLTGWAAVAAKPVAAKPATDEVTSYVAEPATIVDEDGWSRFEVERAAGVVDRNTSWGDFACM